MMSQLGIRKRLAEDVEAGGAAKRQALEGADRDVCERCGNIPWSQLMEHTPRSRFGKVIAPIAESKESLALSQCPICRIFSSMYRTTSESNVCQLKAFSSRLSFVYDDKTSRKDGGLLPPKQTVPECTILYLVPKSGAISQTNTSRTGWHQQGCIGLERRGAKAARCGPRILSPERIDYNLIRQWMSQCRVKQHKTCVPPRKNGLRGLKVIDCQTKSVIVAPTICNYVAVSYVWGDSPLISLATSTFAPVIEDSISVTLSLGLRYLWVDRYCIDQADPNKQYQIDRMDKIYSSAELTLIAAAGIDGTYGLPGLSKRARNRQEQVEVGPITLIRIPPHTSSVLRSSAWASRGWTYQEGVLSRRRLIFTDDQVSFLCNEMHCVETANMPPEPVNQPERENPFIGILPRVVNSGRGKKDLWVEFRDIKGHIMEYSERKLSYDSDALNAILGIFNSLLSSKDTLLRHMWGVPIKASKPSSSLILPLNWYHDKPARRRDGFPSWSWIGWDGGVRMIDPDVEVPGGCEIEVQSETGNDDSISLFQYANPANEYHSQSKILRITAKMIHVTLVAKTWGDLNDSFSQRTQNDSVRFLDGIHAKLPITDATSALVYAYLDQEAVSPEDVLGLVLRQKTSKTCLGILLLKQHGELYQRVGMLRYRDGSGTEAGGEFLPQIIYVDADENILEEIEDTSESPLWLQRANVRTLSVV